MMKSALFLAMAGLAAAQNLTGEPDCAIPCLSSAISKVCTPAADQGCTCASQSAIANNAVSCLLSSCNSSELLVAESAGSVLCIDYSATAAGTASSTTTGTAATATGAANSTITSAATLTSTSSSSGSGAATSTGSSSSSTGSASAGGAAAVQGSAAAGAGLLGLLLAGLAAL